MSAYAATVSMRKLFAILVAVSVLFGPALTRAGELYAAVPDHQMQMMESGHCKSPGSDEQDDGPTKNCCIANSTAIAVSPSTSAASGLSRQQEMASFVPRGQVGYLGEIATPPPRLA